MHSPVTCVDGVGSLGPVSSLDHAVSALDAPPAGFLEGNKVH